MKRIISVVLACTLLLTACSSTGSTNRVTDSQSVETEQVDIADDEIQVGPRSIPWTQKVELFPCLIARRSVS